MAFPVKSGYTDYIICVADKQFIGEKSWQGHITLTVISEMEEKKSANWNRQMITFLSWKTR